MHVALAPEDVAVEAHVPGLAPVVELLAQAGRDLVVDQLGIDRRVVTPVEREDQPELGEVGLDRTLDPRILQLAGELAPVVRTGLVDLAQRGRGRGLEIEAHEALLPVGPELGRHATAHERAAHGRCCGLKLGQLRRILGGQRVGDGRQHLGDLHQRTLQSAKGRAQLARMLGPVEGAAEEARTREPGRLARHGTRHLGIAAHALAQAVLAFGGRCRADTIGQERTSSTSSS